MYSLIRELLETKVKSVIRCIVECLKPKIESSDQINNHKKLSTYSSNHLNIETNDDVSCTQSFNININRFVV